MGNKIIQRFQNIQYRTKYNKRKGSKSFNTFIFFSVFIYCLIFIYVWVYFCSLYYNIHFMTIFFLFHFYFWHNNISFILLFVCFIGSFALIVFHHRVLVILLFFFLCVVILVIYFILEFL